MRIFFKKGLKKYNRQLYDLAFREGYYRGYWFGKDMGLNEGRKEGVNITLEQLKKKVQQKKYEFGKGKLQTK